MEGWDLKKHVFELLHFQSNIKSLIDFELKANKKSEHSVIINLLKLPSRLKSGSVTSDSNSKKVTKMKERKG
jgi:hypothetical protein